MLKGLRLACTAFAVCFSPLNFTVSAFANDLPVDLELVLAVDMSASMSPDEQHVQRQGYVDAFRSRRVLEALRSGHFGRIAVAYVEWADTGNQNLVVPWTLLHDQDSTRDFVEALALAPIGRDFNTSMSGALLFSRGLFDGNGFAGERKAIDLSANGPNNQGPSVETARDAVVADGVTINGLPIMMRLRWGAGLYSIVGLEFYFEDCVIGGPGAFVMAVKSLKEFAATIERKLILEIAARPDYEVMQIANVTRPQKMDCMAGEKNSGRLLPAK